MTLGQIRACSWEEPLNREDPSLQCHSPLGKAGGLAGLHGAAGFGVNLWWACWLGLNLTEGASAGVGGRLMPQSIPAGTHSPVWDPPALLSNRSLPS